MPSQNPSVRGNAIAVRIAWALVSSRFLPGVTAVKVTQIRHGCLEDSSKDRGRDGCTLSPDLIWIDGKQAVEPDLGRPALAVPGTGADVHPVSTRACLLGLVAIVVLRRQIQAPEVARPRALPSTNEQHRTVFALAWIILKGHPSPHHLTRIWLAIGLRGVVEREPAGGLSTPGGLPPFSGPGGPPLPKLP